MSHAIQFPKQPYYAVIFSSTRTEGDNGYAVMAKQMVDLAAKQPGFIGVESARDSELGITVSYWESLEAIQAWRENTAHQVAQQRGKSEWYSHFSLKVCKVERDAVFNR